MTTRIRRRADLHKREVARTETSDQSWNGDSVYNLGHEYRRVLFLELMAWAICHVESFDTREEADAFFAELKRTRRERWGEMPWPRSASDPEAYFRNIRVMADVFAHADGDVNFPNRRTSPLES
jgi:hypothetical protein